MLMEVALDTAAQQAADDEGYRADNIITTDTSEAAEDFLQEHLMAKIVVVIDTHCLENGFLLWRGTTADDYKACTLLEVSTMDHHISRANISIDLEGLHPVRGLSIPL